MQKKKKFFLSAFEKLQKATISVVMSVRLPVCMERLDFHWTNFHEIFLYVYFSKICRENSSFIKTGQ